MANMSPSRDVLSTYELLEATLQHLALGDLFRLQRVSTAWRDVIRRSHKLQTRMLLTSTQAPLQPVFKDRMEWPPEYEQDLEIHSGFQVLGRKSRRRCKQDHVGHRTDYALHKIGFLDPTTEKAQQAASTRAFDPLDYSCYDMLVTEPPVTTVDIVEEALGTGDGDWKTPVCSIRNPAGVRIRDVCRAAGAAIRSHEAVTGESLQHGRFGFVLVDRFVPESMRVKMGEGKRFGGCRVCELGAQGQGMGA